MIAFKVATLIVAYIGIGLIFYLVLIKTGFFVDDEEDCTFGIYEYFDCIFVLFWPIAMLLVLIVAFGEAINRICKKMKDDIIGGRK